VKTVAFENQEFHPLETLAIGHTKFGCAYFPTTTSQIFVVALSI
jgi:hypothetical protein